MKNAKSFTSHLLTILSYLSFLWSGMTFFAIVFAKDIIINQAPHAFWVGILTLIIGGTLFYLGNKEKQIKITLVAFFITGNDRDKFYLIATKPLKSSAPLPEGTKIIIGYGNVFVKGFELTFDKYKFYDEDQTLKIVFVHNLEQPDVEKQNNIKEHMVENGWTLEEYKS